MSAFRFCASPKVALRGAREIVIVCPARALTGKWASKVLDRGDQKLLARMAEEVTAGPRGTVCSTLASASTWLRVVVLPDKVSRYNSPARAEAIRTLVAGAGITRKGPVGIVVVLEDAEHALPALNAIGRALPIFSRKSKARALKVAVAAVDVDGKAIDIEAAGPTVEIAREMAELVDTPPSELDPAALATRARQQLEGLKKVRVQEHVGDALLELGLRGIHAVGRAAVSSPRVVVATHQPAGNKSARKHVVLVGKGVTFDTGGLHVKMRGFMEGMKSDMGGAAAVLGAFRVLVGEGCPHNLTLLLCLAENAIAGASYKPDDILTMHSGKTVEINNTDAEGRLLLADGVSYAARELKADVIIDAATLTGAQLIATGLVHAAVMSDDADLEAAAIAAGRKSGDLVHPLPFAPELYQREFASPVADMRNSVANRNNAQSSCAAQFIHAHLADAPGAARRRWCHIDLAGPAFVKDRATGFGVALIAELVRSLPA